MPATHPLQSPLDALVDYLTDARHLYQVSTIQRAELARIRRAQGNATGAGQPGARYKSVNRAVVVASVGAMEAFFEDLALTALPSIAGAQTSDAWFQVDGRTGMVQTPSPWNIAKMLWVYFRYDPRPDWDVLVTTAWSEVGQAATNWRGTTTGYNNTSSPTASEALNAMVKVRHGFAHQDDTARPCAVAGVVSITPRGNLSLQSHHAFNSMSLVAQIAVQTTMGLAQQMPRPAKFKWRKAMSRAGFEDLLADTPAAVAIQSSWSGSPF